MNFPFKITPSDWVGPKFCEAMAARAEAALEVSLPESYLNLLRLQNGGVLRKTRFLTEFPTSWAPDHFQVDVIMGIGYDEGIDRLSEYLIDEWGYPNIGVVFGMTPSAGHDTVMFDYSSSGRSGEPAVAYIGEDRIARRVADSVELGRFHRFNGVHGDGFLTSGGPAPAGQAQGRLVAQFVQRPPVIPVAERVGHFHCHSETAVHGFSQQQQLVSWQVGGFEPAPFPQLVNQIVEAGLTRRPGLV
jgi:hypothetical protein